MTPKCNGFRVADSYNDPSSRAPLRHDDHSSRGTDIHTDDTTPTAVYLDVDTVLLATHQERRGPELGLQADITAGIERLAEVADKIVALVDPTPMEGSHGPDSAHRIQVLREGMGTTADRLDFVTCPHGETGDCDCAKPGSGLIEQAIKDLGLQHRGGWYITADQEGVVAGRNAGLRTVRIGPVGEDHLSAVHRADYEARDLLDAANRILMETLG